MRNSIIIALLLLITGYSNGQSIDRSKKPAAGPAPVIQLKDSKTFTLPNGLKVFVVENNKLPRVSFSLVLDNDPIMEGESVGFVDVTGSLIGTATKTRSKENIDESIDLLGATFSSSSDGFYASALSKNKEALLEIVSDIILNPVFKQEELDKIKKQTISSLQTEKDDANAIASKVRRALLFGSNHPYGQITTEKSVESIQLIQCKNYFETYFRPNKGYLAVVGDITFDEAKKLIEKYFNAWEKKDVPSHSYPTPKAPSNTRVIFVNKPGAVQTVINIAYPVDLKPGSIQAIPASILNNILGGADTRLFNNLREKHGYTYGAYSELNSDRFVGYFNAFAQVRNSVTDSAVYQFLYELRRIRTEDIPIEELKGIQNFMTGNFARSLERPQTVANFAINTERYSLDKNYYKSYLQTLNAQQPADISLLAKSLILPDQAYIICVGNKDEVAGKLASFSGSNKVEFFDYNGKEIKNPSTPIPSDVTASAIIKKYIDAVGGEKNWGKIKTIKMVMGATVQNMSLDQTVIKKAPNKLFTELKLNGAMVMQKTIFDGEKGKESGMQGSKDISQEKLESVKENAAMLTEMLYLNPSQGYILKILSIEKIGESEAYQIEVVSPSGNKTYHFFDKSSGLKLREMNVIEGPTGQATQITDLSEYKELKGGIKLPHKLTIDMGAQLIEMKMKSVEVNIKIDDTTFSLN